MNDIADRVQTIIAGLPKEVQLIAVSKSQPIDAILAAMQARQVAFGESRPQELQQKTSLLSSEPIQWHFIGHLQTNKVKYVVPLAYMIHSVDSLKLLEAINKESINTGYRSRCLLQVHIAVEETKYGFSPEELLVLCKTLNATRYPGIEFSGLMAMASNTNNEDQISHEFAQVKLLLNTIQNISPFHTSFKELSMGMSNDYHLAIAQGATLVRVGSTIFAPQ